MAKRGRKKGTTAKTTAKRGRRKRQTESLSEQFRAMAEQRLQQGQAALESALSKTKDKAIRAAHAMMEDARGVLRTLGNAASGTFVGNGRGRGQKRGGKSGGGSFALGDSEAHDKGLAVLKDGKGKLTTTELSKAAGGSAKWPKVLAVEIQEGKVKQGGKGRGTTFEWVG